MPDVYWREIIEVFFALGFFAGLHRLLMIVARPWLDWLLGPEGGEWDDDPPPSRRERSRWL